MTVERITEIENGSPLLAAASCASRAALSTTDSATSFIFSAVSLIAPLAFCATSDIDLPVVHAVSPGSGFGPGGEGFVRFALVENEQRITQAVRGMRRALPKLG